MNNAYSAILAFQGGQELYIPSIDLMLRFGRAEKLENSSSISHPTIEKIWILRQECFDKQKKYDEEEFLKFLKPSWIEACKKDIPGDKVATIVELFNKREGYHSQSCIFEMDDEETIMKSLNDSLRREITPLQFL